MPAPSPATVSLIPSTAGTPSSASGGSPAVPAATFGVPTFLPGLQPTALPGTASTATAPFPLSGTPSALQLSLDEFITIILVACVILFFAIEQILNHVVRHTTEATQTASASTAQLCRYSRVAAAAVVLRVASLLVKVGAALALALGLYKPFATLARLALPERVFGFTVLLSYCALVVVVKTVAEDMMTGVKKLLAPVFAAENSRPPSPPPPAP